MTVVKRYLQECQDRLQARDGELLLSHQLQSHKWVITAPVTTGDEGVPPQTVDPTPIPNSSFLFASSASILSRFHFSLFSLTQPTFELGHCRSRWFPWSKMVGSSRAGYRQHPVNIPPQDLNDLPHTSRG